MLAMLYVHLIYLLKKILHQHTFTVYSTKLQLNTDSQLVVQLSHSQPVWTLFLVLNIFTNEALFQQQSPEQNTDGQWKPVS